MNSFTRGHPINLAWAQLSHQRGRLLVAMAGIAFADMLMFIQLGVQTALFDSNTRIHHSLNADLVLLSPKASNFVNLSTLPHRRIYQTLSFSEVQSANPLYVDSVSWKTPQSLRQDKILLLGIDPKYSAFSVPSLEQELDNLKLPDTILFDRGSRGDYAQTLAELDAGATATREINGRINTIVGSLFLAGASFGADGNAVTSDLNFHRILPNRHPSQISAGLIRLKPGVDPTKMARILQAYLPKDVRVLTKAEFIDFEKRFWSANTAVGFIFNLGTGIGFIVGVVIVYQILSNDVADHTAEYATLKAMGYRNSYLLGVVFQEAIILAILGFIPGSVIAVGFYSLMHNATKLPIYMTLSRSIMVLLLTLLMCLMSGAIATSKLRAADPADIF